MPKLDVDPETGMVRSGRFAGHHVDEVYDYLEDLEKASAERPGGEPPATPPNDDKSTPPSRDPKTELANRSGARIEAIAGITGATAIRLEQDDEEGFAATVPDYDKKGADGKSYREKIAEMKKSMHAAARTQRGVHKNAYLFLKTQEADVQKKLLGQEELPDDDANDDPVEDPPPPPPPPGDGSGTPPPVDPPKPPAQKPAAAPPAAPPSQRSPGGRRQAPPPPAGPKLKPTEKVQRIAAAFGMTVEAYLKQLDEQGVSQELVDTMSVPRNTAGGSTVGGYRRKTVFDR